MKKFIYLALIVVMLVSLAGCFGTGSAGDLVPEGDNAIQNYLMVWGADRFANGLAPGDIDTVLTSNGPGSLPSWQEPTGTSGQITWAEVSADHSYGGVSENGTIGETLAFGDLCYYKSDGKWWLTDSDAAATTDGLLAICVLGGDADATGTFLTFGYVRDDSWAWGTVGGALYVDVTAGDMSHTAPSGSGDQVRRVGFAKTADIIYFAPDTMIIELT